MGEETKPKLPKPAERVRLIKPMGKHLFRFLAFIVCAAIFVAAFAASGIWSRYGTATETSFDGFFHRKRVTENEQSTDPVTGESDHGSEPSIEQKDDPSDRSTPDGAISVFGKTLSETNDQTVDRTELDWKLECCRDEPSVLILCTYPREAYLSESSDYLVGTLGDLIYSNETSRCVTSVAETLRKTLEQNGVNAVFRYAEGGDSLQGAHTRAAALIAEVLNCYPNIRYVVDVGRDILTDSEGNCIRTVTEGTDKPTAQVLAVVGTDYGDSSCSAWRENLAFAEALGAELNGKTPTVFRGVSLRTSSINQQFAVRSLSLKIGSCANTAEEAERAAETVGKALAKILLK